MIKDLVSVIIPAYNRAHLIKRSIFSVLNQSYSNLELIIVDDGSTDNTEDVVKSINDNRIIYIKQSNQGACAARNNGIDLAKGEFIAFQDSDDVWHEDKLEKQIKCLKYTGADLSFCPLNKVENGKVVGLLGDNFKEGFIASSEFILGGSTQTLCAESKVFKDVRFDIEMPRLQDFELLLRVQKKYTMYYIGEPMVDYSVQTDSISSNPEKIFKAYELIFAKHKDFLYKYSDKDYERIINYLIMCAVKRTSDCSLRKDLILQSYKIYPHKVKIVAKILKNFVSKIYHSIF